jgi:hypothetical protein
MQSRIARLVVVGWSVLASGCTLVVGDGELSFSNGGSPSSAGGGGAPGSGGDGGAPNGGAPNGGAPNGGAPNGGAPSVGGGGSGGVSPTCEDECVPLPDGFQGPVVVSSVGCGGDAPLAELQSLVNAPPPTCACDCGTPSGTCEQFSFTTYSNGSCGANPNNKTVMVGQCTSVSGSGISYEVEPMVTGSCPVTTSIQLPDATFADHSVCPSESPGRCPNGDICLPDGPACVFAEGDVPCPSAFSIKTLEYESFADGRSCSSAGCSCSAPSGTCAGDVEIRSNAQCSGTGSNAAISECKTNTVLNSDFVKVTVNSSILTCEAMGSSNPAGAVVGQMPSTICCRP